MKKGCRHSFNFWLKGASVAHWQRRSGTQISDQGGEMPIVSEMVHPKGLNFANQRKVAQIPMLLPDILVGPEN